MFIGSHKGPLWLKQCVKIIYEISEVWCSRIWGGGGVGVGVQSLGCGF